MADDRLTQAELQTLQEAVTILRDLFYSNYHDRKTVEKCERMGLRLQRLIARLRFE
jgi:hypothetical protein